MKRSNRDKKTAKQTHSEKVQERRDNGRFISDTEATLARLQDAHKKVADSQRSNNTAMRGIADRLNENLGSVVNKMLPDLKSFTISRLKINAPGFVTQQVQNQIDDAYDVRVPIFTRIFGGTAKYKAQALDQVHEQLKVKLRSWLNQPGNYKGADADAATKYAELQEASRTLAEQERKLSEQIAKLEQIRAAYSRKGAPAPDPKLVEAITNSAGKAHTIEVRTRGRSEREFDSVNDVLIPLIIWESVLRPHLVPEVHHHYGNDFGRDNFRSGGGASQDYTPIAGDRGGHDRGGGFQVNTASEQDSGNDDRGGGFQVNASSERDNNDRGGGFEIGNTASASAFAETSNDHGSIS